MPQILQNKEFDYIKMGSSPEELFDEAIGIDKPETAVLVVPTGKMVRNYRHYAVREYFKAKNKPCERLNIFTLSTFAQYIYSALFNDNEAHFISDAYMNALFEEAVLNASPTIFNQEGRNFVNFALIEKISNIIIGLKEEGITPDKLKSDLETQDKIRDFNRLRDFAKIFEEYENLIGSQYLDYPAMLNKLTVGLSSLKKQENLFDNITPDKIDELSKLFNSILPEGAKILFYGFSEFTVPELEFIYYLARSGEPVALNLDFTDKNGPLFSNLQDTRHKLISAGYNAIETPDEDDSEKEESNFHFIRKYLFNPLANKKNESLSKIVKIIKSVDRKHEVTLIARFVKYLHFTENVPLHKMCIVSRQPEKYANLFREEFYFSKIPVNVSDRFHLLSSPPVISVLSVLDLIEHDFRIEDLKKVIRSPYIKLPNNQSQYEKILTIAAKLRLTGGRKRGGADNIINKISSFHKNLNLRLDSLQSENDEEALEKQEIENDMKSAGFALKAIKELAEYFKTGNLKMYPDEFAGIIKKRVIIGLNIKNKIISMLDDVMSGSYSDSSSKRIRLLEEVEKDARALTEFINILDEFEFIFKDRYPGEKFYFGELNSRFKTALSGAKYQIKEKYNYGVNVTSIEQTRGLNYHVMFLCGAVDGEFPIPYRSDKILGKELPGSEKRHRKSERMLFYQFLANNPEELDNGKYKIYISYPGKDDDRDTVRSQFIDELLKIIDDSGNNCFIDTVTDETLPVWCNSIGTDIELQKYIFNNWSNEESILVSEKISHSEYEYLDYYYTGKTNEKTGDGFNILDSYKEYLNKYSGKAYSVSELETYAKCPYKYFAERVLKIKEKEDFDLFLSPLEKGNLFHRILYKFYMTLLANKPCEIPDFEMPLVCLENFDMNFLENTLIHIAEDEIRAIEFSHPFFKLETSRFINTEERRGTLLNWLREEYERSKAWHFKPGLFETGFGVNSFSKGYIPPIELGPGFKLRGKIDRMEFSASGNDYFLIADYKISLGSVGNNTDIKKGYLFQIPLYLMAAQKLLNIKYGMDLKPAGGVYYPLKFTASNTGINSYQPLAILKEYAGNSYQKKRSHWVNGDQELNDLIDTSFEFALEIKKSISEGKFPIQPKDDNVCKYCDFMPVCRLNQRPESL